MLQWACICEFVCVCAVSRITSDFRCWFVLAVQLQQFDESRWNIRKNRDVSSPVIKSQTAEQILDFCSLMSVIFPLFVNKSHSKSHNNNEPTFFFYQLSVVCVVKAGFSSSEIKTNQIWLSAQLKYSPSSPVVLVWKKIRNRHRNMNMNIFVWREKEGLCCKGSTSSNVLPPILFYQITWK